MFFPCQITGNARPVGAAPEIRPRLARPGDTAPKPGLSLRSA